MFPLMQRVGVLGLGVGLALLSAACAPASAARRSNGEARPAPSLPADAVEPPSAGEESFSSAPALAPSVEAQPASPPRPGAGSFIALEVPDYLPAVLWVPESSGPRPLVIATHGAGGRPEAHCARWREIVAQRGFVLCVRGRKTNPRDDLSQSHHYYPDHLWLGRALRANIGALRAAYPGDIDFQGVIYTGYSQGAVMGALALMERPRAGEEPLPFSAALLIEGQQNDWSVATAQRWAEGGARRVALLCGIPRCDQAYRKSQFVLQQGGFEVNYQWLPGAGHTYLGPIAPAVEQAFEWLIQHDSRWR